MLVLPRKPQKVRVLQCRIGCVLEVRLRTTTWSLAFHAFESPWRVRNIRFGAGLGSSRHAPRPFSAAQPHTRNVRVLRRRRRRGRPRTAR